MSSSNIKNICFIGAGTMGCFNSLVASVAGYECKIFDQSEDVLNERINNQTLLAQYLNQSNFFEGKDISSAISRIKNCNNINNALEKADLVSESIPENLNLKIKLFNEIESIVNKNIILTTNTSSLSIKKISEGLHPDTKFAALHSYLGSKLMDVVRGAYTSDQTINSLVDYIKSVDSYPLILNKEHQGYVLNFMLSGLLTQSLLMVIENKHTIQDIDAAWKDLNSSQFGPFGMMDMFGLDVVRQAWQEKDSDSFHLMYKDKIVDLLSQYTDKNYLGLKTFRGFYNYKDIDINYKKDNFAEIQKDLCVSIIEAAVVLHTRKIVHKDEINKAWIVGTNLSKGPFDFLSNMGITSYLKNYEEWVARDYISPEFHSLVRTYLSE